MSQDPPRFLMLLNCVTPLSPGSRLHMLSQILVSSSNRLGQPAIFPVQIFPLFGLEIERESRSVYGVGRRILRKVGKWGSAGGNQRPWKAGCYFVLRKVSVRVLLCLRQLL